MRRHELTCALIALLCVVGAPPSRAQRLYWIDTKYAAPTLRTVKTDGSGLHTLTLTPGSLPEGLAFDPNAKNLYWCDARWTSAALHRCDLGPGAPATLVGGLSCMRGLDIDPAASRLYWTSSNLNTGSVVKRSDLSGGSAVTLVSLGSNANLRGIALDPAHNVMFVADFDGNQLRSFDLTGASASYTITLASSPRPYGVAIDPATQTLYWTEYASGRLMRKVYTSAAAPTVLATALKNPTYLTLDVDDDRIYWVEGGAGAWRIASSHLDGTGITTVSTAITSYGDIVYVPASALLGTDAEPAPIELSLGPAMPNPAHGMVTVSYALPHEASVEIVACDVQGRRVATLQRGTMPAGRHTAVWEAASQRLATGMYYLRMRCAGREFVRAVALTR